MGEKDGSVRITAPWGESKEVANNNKNLIEYGLQQLEYFRDVQGNKTQYLKDDIKGYKIILNSDFPEENADRFLAVKKDAISKGKRFKDNLAVISHLKRKGLWARKAAV